MGYDARAFIAGQEQPLPGPTSSPAAGSTVSGPGPFARRRQPIDMTQQGAVWAMTDPFATPALDTSVAGGAGGAGGLVPISDVMAGLGIGGDVAAPPSGIALPSPGGLAEAARPFLDGGIPGGDAAAAAAPSEGGAFGTAPS